MVHITIFILIILVCYKIYRHTSDLTTLSTIVQDLREVLLVSI